MALRSRKKTDSRKVDTCKAQFLVYASYTVYGPADHAKLRRKPLSSAKFPRLCEELSAQLATVSRQKLCR